MIVILYMSHNFPIVRSGLVPKRPSGQSPYETNTLLDFMLDRLHHRIFLYMGAAEYLSFERRIVMCQFQWGEVTIYSSPKKNTKIPRPFSIEAGTLLKELGFSHPVDVGVMLALTDTVLYMFELYDSTKYKDVKKALLLEETKDFYHKIASLKEVNYVFSLDFFLGVTQLPKELLLQQILLRLEDFGKPVEPIRHLLISYVHLSYNDSYWTADGLIPIHPLSTAIYTLYLNNLSSLLVGLTTEDASYPIPSLNLFSSFLIPIKHGLLYESIRDSLMQKLLQEVPKLFFKESLIGRDQSTPIFAYGEKPRLLSLTKKGILRIK